MASVLLGTERGDSGASGLWAGAHSSAHLGCGDHKPTAALLVDSAPLLRIGVLPTPGPLWDSTTLSTPFRAQNSLPGTGGQSTDMYTCDLQSVEQLLLLVTVIRVTLLGSVGGGPRPSQHAGALGGHGEDWAKLWDQGRVGGSPCPGWRGLARDRETPKRHRGE